jgi:hypothetical protein
MTTIRNNAVIAATCNQRIDALENHVSAKTAILINGVTYKPATLIAVYQAVLDGQAALIKSRAQVEVDLAARRDAETKRDAFEPHLKSWVLNTLGAESTAASEFGYAPPKKATKSAEDVANAVKLAKATRVARGTMGKKQRSKIKGSLDTPPAPADPAVNATAAASAATGGVAPVSGATK